MKTNLLRNMLATIVALFISMFALPQKAMAEDYDIWIIGRQVTSANCNDLSVIDGVTGKAKYDPNTKTLTLDNANINAEGDWNGIMADISGLTILVKGTVNVTANKAKALLLRSTTTIKGDGTLNATSIKRYGINVDKTYLTIDGCTVNAKGKAGIEGYDGNSEKLTVRNATVTAEGNEYGSIHAIDDLTLDGCEITQPAGATFSPTFNGVVLNGRIVTTKVVIQQKDTQAPSAPSITSMTSTTNSITVNWSKSTDNMTPQNELRYRVCYRVAGSGGYTNGNWVTNQTSYTVTGLDNETDYELYVEARDNADNSANSNKKTIRTKDTQAPSAPSITSMTSTANSITVNWSKSTDNMTPQNELRYCVCYRVVGSGEFSSGNWMINRTSYTVTGLDNETEYELYVEARNNAGNTANSDKKTIRTRNDVIAYDLSVAGVQVTSLNCSDLSVIPGVSGTASYDPASKTLTLENVTISKTGIGDGIFGKIAGLTVQVKGTVNVTTELSNAIGSTQPMTITGGGTLNATSSGSNGIYANETDLTIDGCTVNAKGKIKGITGWNGSVRSLTIRNATVTAEGNEYGSICNFKDITLDGCAITQPTGAAFDASLHGVVLNGKIVKEKVVITRGANSIEAVSADVPLKKQGIYTLHGVRLNTTLDRLPAGIYIVNGKKVVKN